MSSHFVYMLVNLGCIGVPFLFSFHPKLRFYKEWDSLLIGMISMMALFIPWDIYFTSKGIWGFNDHYTLGYKLWGLPMEEWLFFICIPYACLFTYHCLTILLKKLPSLKMTRITLTLVVGVELAVAVIAFDRWYAFAAHFLCAAFLSYHLYIKKSTFLPLFMSMYVFVLPAFLTSNGILTGVAFWEYPFLNSAVSEVKDMVVWYNNNHNLSFRFFSMPADDLAYGMLMLLMTVSGFEWNKQRKAKWVISGK